MVMASTGCRERQKSPIIKIPLRFMVHFPRLRIPFTYSKKNFQKYGKRTFKLTSATKYYTAELDGNYRISKTRALRCCKRLNGLSVRLKVKNGKVVSMTFGS